MIAIVLLNVIDLVVTYAMLDVEANPVVRGIVSAHGFGGFVLSKALLIALLYLIHRVGRLIPRLGWMSTLTLRTAVGIYIVVTAWNLRYLLIISVW